MVGRRTLFDKLSRIKNAVQAAVLLLTPEGVATNQKGNQIIVPNLNVLFRFDFFYSALDHDRVAILKCGTVNMPSDLAGYMHHMKKSDFFKS